MAHCLLMSCTISHTIGYQAETGNRAKTAAKKVHLPTYSPTSLFIWGYSGTYICTGVTAEGAWSSANTDWGRVVCPQPRARKMHSMPPFSTRRIISTRPSILYNWYIWRREMCFRFSATIWDLCGRIPYHAENKENNVPPKCLWTVLCALSLLPDTRSIFLPEMRVFCTPEKCSIYWTTLAHIFCCPSQHHGGSQSI